MRGVVDTLVVGAGLSGLAYAHARGPGADLLVLEATERPGGLVRTTRAQLEGGGALQFEWGPELLPAEAPLTAAEMEGGFDCVAAACAATTARYCASET